MANRKRKTAQARKAEIKEAALALAFEVGPDIVSTRMIADRLHLTQPAIYKHFPCKEDIWGAVSEQMAAKISDNIQRAGEPGTTPQERLHLLVMGQLQLMQKYPALPEIMIARDALGNLQTGRVRLQDAMAGFRRAIALEIRAAVDQGIFRAGLSAGDGAALVLGIIQSLVLQMLIGRNPGKLLDDGERLFNLLLAGFMKNK